MVVSLFLAREVCVERLFSQRDPSLAGDLERRREAVINAAGTQQLAVALFASRFGSDSGSSSSRKSIGSHGGLEEDPGGSGSVGESLAVPGEGSALDQKRNTPGDRIHGAAENLEADGPVPEHDNRQAVERLRVEQADASVLPFDCFLGLHDLVGPLDVGKAGVRADGHLLGEAGRGDGGAENAGNQQHADNDKADDDGSEGSVLAFLVVQVVECHGDVALVEGSVAVAVHAKGGFVELLGEGGDADRGDLAGAIGMSLAVLHMGGLVFINCRRKHH
mmetsp:Transcript_11402/g.32840  ORF Transcript_11402/g.32840 Transcript_11402/m.32840 type:complete len:277 (-) Transcript_11402:521-1351(-)